MSQVHVEATRVIDAPPQDIYAILADYRQSHPAILPKQYFKDLTVLEGGVGEGTVFTFRMRVLGADRPGRMMVSEPEPGRVLMETDPAQGIVTTFTVEPLAGGTQARVTIATEVTTSRGLKGLIEKWLNPRVLLPIYHQELEQLDGYVREQRVPA